MNWTQYIPQFPSLAKGSHLPGSHRLCAMELVAYMERLPHSDSPPCTCPVLAAYTRCLNDHIPGEWRNALLPLLPMLVGTVNPALEQERAEFFAMAVVTDLVPNAIEPIIGPEKAERMRRATTLDEARDEARDADADAAQISHHCHGEELGSFLFQGWVDRSNHPGEQFQQLVASVVGNAIVSGPQECQQHRAGAGR